MKLLLDTHVLIWLAEGADTLGEPARELIDRAATSGGVVVSAISFWEVAMLARRGRISLSQPLATWRQRVLATAGLGESAIDGDIAIESVELPGSLHTDPADRLIVATVRVRGWELATRDRRLLDYGAAGHANTVAV